MASKAKGSNLEPIVKTILSGQGIKYEDWLQSKYMEFISENASNIAQAVKLASELNS